MSKIRLFTNPLDANSVIEYDIEAGTLLIDWLQQEYPDGFHGVLRVFIGPDELALENLDYPVKDEEQITLLVMPGDGGVIATIAIQALVSIAIGYVINLIFGPATPSGYDQEEQSPVYSLAPTPNQMRLGKPIEVQYGTCLATPAYASSPYEFYDGSTNEMYADQLMCLGHGDFIIHEILIGDTPISSMEAGSIQYWQIPQSTHLNSEKNVEDYINNALAPTDNPFPFAANMYTSPEVDGWEFNETLGNVYPTPAAFAGDAYAATTDPATGSFIKDRIENVDETLFLPKDENDPDNPQTGPFGAGLQIGDFIRLTGTLTNNVTFKIGAIVASTPGFVTIFQDHNETSVLSDEIPLAGGATYTLNETTEVSNMIAGPYRCQKQGFTVDRVYVDIEFPEGLYHVDKDDDRFTTNSISMEITLQEIDENGDPVGAPAIRTPVWSSNKRNPIRDTVTMFPATAGAFEITVERVNPVSDNNRDIEKVVWTGLRARVVPFQTGSYSDTTLLAVRMKATNGLGSAARQRLRVKQERIPNIGYSANPASAVKDIWTNTTYGLGRDINELNLTEVNALEERWNTVDGPKLNGIYDTKSTAFAGMQQAVSIAAARIIQDGGFVTIVQDGIQNVRKALYSSANMVKDSFNLDFTFDTDSEYNAIEVESRNADTWQTEYSYFPVAKPSPLYADTYQLFGCTDLVYAGYYANYLANVKERRRKVVNFTTELEGLLPRFGDRIGVASDIPYWGESGVVVDVLSSTFIKVDKQLTWTTNNVMILRDDMGGQLGEYTVTQGGADDIVEFGEAVVAYGPEGQEPTNYIFGEQTTLIRDFQVTKISPDTETTVTIEAQVYDPLIYEGGPPHQQPGTCKQYECDAFENALIASSAIAIWPMNAGGPNEGVVPSIRIPVGGEITGSGGVSEATGTQLLAGACAAGTAYSYGNGGVINSADGIYGELTFTMHILTRGGNTSIMRNDYNYGNGTSVSIDRVSGNTLRIKLTTASVETAVYDYVGVSPVTASSILLRFEDGVKLTAYVDFNLVGTETGIPSIASGQVQRRLGFGGGVTSSSESNYAAYWDTYITDEEVATLKQAYQQNDPNYVDPDPGCIPAP